MIESPAVGMRVVCLVNEQPVLGTIVGHRPDLWAEWKVDPDKGNRFSVAPEFLFGSLIEALEALVVLAENSVQYRKDRLAEAEQVLEVRKADLAEAKELANG